MRISKPEKKNITKNKKAIISLSLTIFTLFLPIVIGLIYKSSFVDNQIFKDHVFCDAENIIIKKNKTLFIYKSNIFHDGHTQSSEKAFTGKYSSKVHSEAQYGFTYIIKNVNEGEIYQANVWRFSQNNIGKLVAEGSWNFWKDTDIPISKTGTNWELLQLRITVPKGISNADLKFYVWNINKDSSYFDDFFIKKIDYASLVDLSNIKILTIKIDKKELKKLSKKRDEAFRKGILVTGADDFVKVKLLSDNKEIPAFARLKGDWLDHLQGKKWSFRIKTNGKYAWNRMKEFSVQNPNTRHFLSEWVFHKLLEYEDILTTSYEFIVLNLNNDRLGVYVYEEHFTFDLLERQHRKKGLIVRADEDGLWDAGNRDPENQHSTALLAGMDILPFEKNKTIKSKILFEQFKKAQNLMLQYKLGLRDASDIFDIEKLSKYYAILDLTKAFHGLSLHNQRMYYNPITEKLEPIGFDGYDPLGVFDWIKRPFIGYYKVKYRPFLENIFKDMNFMEKYVNYLYLFSQPEYLYNFFETIDNDLLKRELFIQTEFSNYKYDKTFIFKNAQNIRNHLIPYEKLAVKVYLQKFYSDENELKVGSTHALPIELIGIGNNDSITKYIPGRIILPAYNLKDLIKYKNIKVAAEGNFIFYKVVGLDPVYKIDIKPWPVPSPSSIAAQALFNGVKNDILKNNDIYTVKDSMIIFHAGNHRIEKNIIIPQNYIVKFLAGTKLNFVNSSMFISKSPLHMYGNEEDPIFITSDDGTSNGFTVLQAKDKSHLVHVIFDNLAGLNYEKWTLTGAVTFYESDVEFLNCKFLKIKAEDALNIIRSNFTILNSAFTNCTADALDADFSKGKISNSIFINTGKDALEFSGSIVQMENDH